VLHDANGLNVRDDAADGTDEPASVKISARVRDIITRNLATPNGSCMPASPDATSGIEQLAEENTALQVCLVFVGLITLQLNGPGCSSH